MIWIALAIIFIGYLINQALEKHHKNIERLKQQELEANPEYRKKQNLEKQIKYLESRISSGRLQKEDLQKGFDKLIKERGQASKKDDTASRRYKLPVTRLLSDIASFDVLIHTCELEIEQIKNQLGTSVERNIFVRRNQLQLAEEFQKKYDEEIISLLAEEEKQESIKS